MRGDEPLLPVVDIMGCKDVEEDLKSRQSTKMRSAQAKARCAKLAGSGKRQCSIQWNIVCVHME